MSATIVLIIDGLSANLPGPYGNTTVETPAFNRLAAESMVFDFCIAESPLLEKSYPILWRDLMEQQSVLVSDCAKVLELSAGHGFDSIVDATGEAKTEPARDISETQTANFFAHAIEAVQALESDGLCWLHHAGFTGQWDAPWELRCSFGDEEDPDPPREVASPVGKFELKDVDPDLLLGYQHCAYAQLSVIDQLLGLFLNQLRQGGVLDQVNFVLASTRGYPLGEHGFVGQFDNLYNETIQVPLMIRQPAETDDGAVFGSRQNGLVQLGELNQMLAGLIDGGFHAVPFCDVANSATSSWNSIQTRNWKLIHPVDSAQGAELFAKPDDRWDMNDVSRRCADVVEELLGVDHDDQLEV